MSRHHERNITPILDAARQWAQRCLVEDGSILGSGDLWTTANFELLDRHFVQQPNDGPESFYEKLDGQMSDAPPVVPQLMAELLWAMLLFPSNITAKTKREGVARVWGHSGAALNLQHPLIADPVLTGIGSAGTAYNNKRWWESLYAISLFRAIKGMPQNERAALLSDYPRLSQWLESMPRDGERQFRHMLRYLLCPDQVERMSTNGDRRRVLFAFGVASKREMKTWTDRQFDDAMLSLRRKLESELFTTDLDFYLPPLVDRWRSGDTDQDGDDDGPGGVGEGQRVATAGRPDANQIAVSAPALNQILFGPPGTGKTYAVVDHALAILDPAFLASNHLKRVALKQRFDALAREQLIRFVTFHQSFSYEDFVEGLRADADEHGTLRYEVVDGVFKVLCSAARASRIAGNGPSPVDLSGRRIWKMSLGASGDEDHIFQECMESGLALIGFGGGADYTGCRTREDIRRVLSSTGEEVEVGDYSVTAIDALLHQVSQGDLLLVTEGNLRLRAIGEVIGEYRHVPRDGQDNYAQARPARWLRQYSPALPYDQVMNKRFMQKTIYELRSGSIDLDKLKGLLRDAGTQRGQAQPRVLIIDEINRGNVSRIFGELITLIEPSKREGGEEALEAMLPYSKQRFSIPSNVHIIGTMNTADRSLAGLDIALRRRFTFVEKPPRPDLLDGLVIEGIDIGRMLARMNERIEALLDRDHCLGHAYFMALSSGDGLDRLAALFREQVLPLLQEYFFEDWQRIAWVLNDHRKAEGYRFVVKKSAASRALFGNDVDLPNEATLWRLDLAAFYRPQSYQGIIDTGPE